MDPQIPSSFNHRTAKLRTGNTYHFVDQLPANYRPDTPTLLCVHGFPDLWFGWRYQIGPWVTAGYRVVVPNMLGYGDTDKPFAAKYYSTKNLCADLVALLDYINVGRAVVIGHDWGSFTASRFAMWHPDRLAALIILSVPFTPPSPAYMPVEDVARLVPNLGYQVYFSQQESTKTIENNLHKFTSLMFRSMDEEKGPEFTKLGQLKAFLENTDIRLDDTESLLTANEFQYYEQEFAKGMNGPLNYYRTWLHRFNEEKEAKLSPKLREDLPVLFFWGTKDPTCASIVIEKAHKFIANLQDVAIEGKGHWLMVEAKETVTEQVLRWLESLQLTPKDTVTSKL
ncbi:hypothetical protein ONZ45_g10924 [Pleurotus djamor]|nr:hypothetical protein ONZ45_g10924 [Pleurotus djamor]